LRACWSTPIFGTDEQLLGTFAIYYDEPRTPTEADIGAIDYIAQAAGLAIERHKSDLELRRQSSELERLNAELERTAAAQRDVFEQMPGFVAVLQGAEHRFSFVNGTYRQLFKSDVTGKAVREAFPELQGQGFFELLDQVYMTGEAVTAYGMPIIIEGAQSPLYLNFIYQPIRGADGAITGVFAGGYDVTEQQRSAIRRDALIRLTDEIRDLLDPDDIAFAAARILGETLQVSRAGYGVIDTEAETITIERDWNAPGIKTLAGVLHFRDYGSYIDDLRRGETVIFGDAEKDPRTTANADALKAISAQAVINMPVTERGRFVALLYLNHKSAREWPRDDIDFIREIAERTRTATERARVTLELRERESELRELNDELEVRVEEALAERRILSDIVESTDALIQVVDTDLRLLAINRAATDEVRRIYGIEVETGEKVTEVFAHLPEEQEVVRGLWDRALRGEAFTLVQAFGDPMQDERHYELKFSPLRNDTGQITGAYQFVFDVTQRVLDQQRLQQAEDQLRQAQKMEAVGQLTGGVAHDFNNMLAVVSGSLELLDRRIGPDEPRSKRLISSALEASRRAGTLTQRLLAFSRQQPLKPEVLDINKLVSNMSDLFRHSIGTHIQLETVLAGGAWRIHADQNQLENVLLNLAVNARDAMPDGGKLTIETQNAHLDQRYALNEPGILPGQYVLIAVTDTGTGMPEEVISKAFDPFFTTKEVGKGTGLGLSQVYGFVKQSGGHIKIYSELGEGSTIKIYLPRHVGPAQSDENTVKEYDLPSADRRELVLVVDDEELVRQFSVEAFTDLGYRVLQASSAQAALTILIERPDVDLLFTDIVMPEMNGRQLADLVKEKRPNLPIIYTTGYTRNAVVHNGVLDSGVELIAKPFTLEELAIRVRAVLDVNEGKREKPAVI
jgi:PAS domain S-box-containing protein